jgi:outer membrane protein assembly factor BamD
MIYRITLYILLCFLAHDKCFASKDIDNGAVIYHSSMHQFIKGNYTVALRGFEDIAKNHITSLRYRDSLVMEIFLNFILNKEDELPSLLNSFVENNPVDRYIPYVKYIDISSRYAMLKDINSHKDVAVKLLQDMISFNMKYQNSKYKDSVNEKIIKTSDFIAMSEALDANFFFEEDEIFAAIKHYNLALKFSQSDDMKEQTRSSLKSCFEILGLEY